MEFLNQISEALSRDVIVLLGILLLGILCIFVATFSFIVYHLASRKYTFYRELGGLNVTVTRYVSGFLPVNKKVYKCVSKIDVEEYIDRDETSSTNCARIFLTLSSGEKLELKKLTVTQERGKIKHIASDITSLMNSHAQEPIVIHNCRTQSFTFLLFALLFAPMLFGSLVFVAFILFGSHVEKNLVEHQKISEQANDTVIHKAITYTESDLPSYIPKVEGAVTTLVEFDSAKNRWTMYLDMQGYDKEASAQLITDACKAKNWLPSKPKDFPAYDADGNVKDESGYIFYCRKMEKRLEGDVMIYKTTSGWESVISVPVDVNWTN